jgi:hypothetical protein
MTNLQLHTFLTDEINMKQKNFFLFEAKLAEGLMALPVPLKFSTYSG